MPKIITEQERERTKKAIIKHTKQLILTNKGIKGITVDDIIQAVGLNKSAFYSYYKSKEECIYDVFEKIQADSFEQSDMILQENVPIKEKVIRFFSDVYLAEDSVIYYVSSTDVEVLFRKLPAEYNEKEQIMMGDSTITYVMKALNFDKIQAETLTMLFRCIDYTATFHEISNEARKESLNTLVLSLAEYIEKNSKMQTE